MTQDEGDIELIRHALAKVQGETNMQLVCRAWEALDRIAAALPVLAQPGDRVARVNARADGSIRAEDAVTYDHVGRKVTWPPDSAWDESDDELSPAAAAALAAGIESAKRGETESFGSFAKYAEDEE